MTEDRIDPDWLRWPEIGALRAAFDATTAQILFVGGAVRNALMGLPVADIDLATELPPDQTITVLEKAGIKTVPTGIDHGTITAVINERAFEITTFRKDIETDGRHALVRFSTDIEDDAARRDFTINALYADFDGQVIDPLGRLQDLRDRKVVFVGTPEDRITEDYLRILRFFRFHAWYGYSERAMDQASLAACAAHKYGLEHLSAERITSEMIRLLSAPSPTASLYAMSEVRILEHVLPNASLETFTDLIALESGAQGNWIRRAADLTDFDLNTTWRLSKKEATRLKRLQTLLQHPPELFEVAYRDGKEMAEDLNMIQTARNRTATPQNADQQIAKGASATFPVKAADLGEGYSGRAIGDRLKALEKHGISSEFSLTRDELLALP